MTLEHFYLVASALALSFIAAIWSSEGWQNITLKVAFVGLAFCGAVIVAKEVLL